MRHPIHESDGAFAVADSAPATYNIAWRVAVAPSVAMKISHSARTAPVQHMHAPLGPVRPRPRSILRVPTLDAFETYCDTCAKCDERRTRLHPLGKPTKTWR